MLGKSERARTVDTGAAGSAAAARTGFAAGSAPIDSFDVSPPVRESAAPLLYRARQSYELADTILCSVIGARKMMIWLTPSCSLASNRVSCPGDCFVISRTTTVIGLDFTKPRITG